MKTVAALDVKGSGHTLTIRLVSVAWPIVLGAASGVACVAIRLSFRLLQWVFVQHTGMLPVAAANLSPERRMLTPILGAGLATLVIWLGTKLSPNQRFEEYVEAARMQGGRISFIATAWRTASSAFSVATGAAIGREGSMIQFATAVTSWVGKRSALKELPLSRQVACGAAAAVAAAYQAPLAGMFFAMEIVLGDWKWVDVLQLAFASGTGYLVSRSLQGVGPLFPVSGSLSNPRDVFWVFPLTLILGLIGPAYQKVLGFSRVAKHLPYALLWAGLAVGLLSLIEPRVWGNGDSALIGLLENKTTVLATVGLLLCRFVATTFCVGTGTVGGVFTPTLFTGAALGIIAGHFVNSPDPWLFAIFGMGLLMSAVTHAPFMAALMAVELTGQWHLLPIILPCSLASAFLARSLSRKSLYAIASPSPAFR